MSNKRRTIIIAEIGECFNGDFDIAKKLMHEAKEAGCDIVKFQTLDYENISEDDPEKEWFKKIALNPEKIRLLIKYAKEIEIQIIFTPENINILHNKDYNIADLVRRSNNKRSLE